MASACGERGLVIAALVFATACVDGRTPSGPDLTRSVQLAVEPVFSVVPAAAEAAALTRLRVTALDVTDGSVVASANADVDPEAREWAITLTVDVTPGIPLRLRIQVELSSPDGSVEWSGESGVVPVLAGVEPREVREVVLYRGPLANLSVTAVEITGAPESLLEGETGQVHVSLHGGGEGARVYFESLDPTVATVDASGRVEALAPGTGGILAEAGRASAQVSFVVTDVVVPDVEVLEASVAPLMDYAGAITGSLADPAGAGAISSSLASLGSALASGDGAASVRALNAAVAAWAAYGVGTPLRVLDGPQLSLVELSLVLAAEALGLPFG